MRRSYLFYGKCLFLKKKGQVIETIQKIIAKMIVRKCFNKLNPSFVNDNK